MTGETYKEKQIALLYEVTRALTSSLDLKESLESILELLRQLMKMNRGTITLLDPATETLTIEVAHGMSTESKQKGRYRIGEGITGKVVASGEAEIVPLVHQDPRFLDRTKSRGDISKKRISFLCVPIKIENETIGALSVDKNFRNNASFQDDVRLLEIVAMMISQVVRHHDLIRRDKARLVGENISLRQKLRKRYSFENIIGHSGRMLEVYDMIHQVADSNANVLIRGESGTGKELVANAIHFNSPRSSGPFIKINCAAVPENLLESELFGHEKGAFTGAVASKEGRFEWANGGTLFLDEIGDMPLSIQVKLLRVIQTKEFERVGGRKTIRVDVRLVAATHRNLEQDVKEGTFREDLYWRINVFPIYLPALRERKDDIIFLADHFLEKYGRDYEKEIKRLSTPAIDLLMSYHWPGNVRELENCIERAVLVCRSNVIRAEHLPPSLQTAETSGTSVSGDLPHAVDNLEREMIMEALKKTHGHQGKAAKALGITERMMGYKIRKHHIIPKVYSSRKKPLIDV
jgi:Nif-specific regulatory protein